MDLIGPHSEGCHVAVLSVIPCLMITCWVPNSVKQDPEGLKGMSICLKLIHGLPILKSGPFAVFPHPSPNINICSSEKSSR